ncbi:hypothetical protein [Zavarzinia aquatilis]|uniref:Uncharacterized protein n=1 Tax=Zavarzinia aquatilis TaxID=2211142 RepID=A0A317EE65_9PROT|nr:hypothetical protein [Zavarzinia aquatilis]PWR24554.1 hypothetical protein DKG74_07045 [Zavarzinia aquatilis]
MSAVAADGVLAALAAVQLMADVDRVRLARLLRLDLPVRQGRGAPDEVRPEGRDAARMGVSSQPSPPRIAGAAAFSVG